MSDDRTVDRNLALEAVRATEAAAIAAVRFMGGGDERAADEAAVEAMHGSLSRMMIDGVVRIGEGAEGEVEKLYVGERVGSGNGMTVDVAVVPLEGKSIVARGGPNALSVVAMAEDGGFLTVPDVYMEKMAVGPGLPEGVVDLDAPLEENLHNLARAKDMAVGDLVVCMLDRPRHSRSIEELRRLGARIRLIQDGDVSGVIQVAMHGNIVDLYLGIGGASQGVLAAAALRGVGGQMQGRLVTRTPEDRSAILAVGIEDPERKYAIEDMASGHVTFAATGVTYGALLKGVSTTPRGAITSSVVMRSMTGTLRYIEGHYDFTRRPAG